jgi:hypothetical protein
MGRLAGLPGYRNIHIIDCPTKNSNDKGVTTNYSDMGNISQRSEKALDFQAAAS